MTPPITPDSTDGFAKFKEIIRPLCCLVCILLAAVIVIGLIGLPYAGKTIDVTLAASLISAMLALIAIPSQYTWARSNEKIKNAD